MGFINVKGKKGERKGGRKGGDGRNRGYAEKNMLNQACFNPACGPLGFQLEPQLSAGQAQIELHPWFFRADHFIE